MFFPFGGPPHGGDDDDGPHGMGGMGGRGRGPVDNEKFYKLLGLEKGANQNDIKKAYRKLAMQHHPDKGGDEAKFKEMSRAYEVLSDDEKRQVYDQYGEDGLDGGGGGGGGGMADIFDMFSGGRGRSRQQKPGKRRGEDVTFPLKVTLEDLYCGTSKKLRLTKNVICSECQGKGGKGEGAQQCRGCRGQGVKIVIRQIGPGMIQQMQTYCTDCNGEGTVIADADKCTGCKGARTTKEKKTLEVFVNKGMRNGERIVFSGEADEAPDTVSGDVVVVLQLKEHEQFRREGAHLFFRKTVSLAEALCGFEFRLKHLDNRVLVVKSAPGAVTKPGDFKAIMNEGMPHPKNIFHKGNLYIEFQLEFPKSGSLPDNTIKLLKKILPAGEHKDDEIALPPEHDDVTLQDVDMEAERRKFAEQQHKEAYDEDDHEEHAHAGPSCRQA